MDILTVGSLNHTGLTFSGCLYWSTGIQEGAALGCPRWRPGQTERSCATVHAAWYLLPAWASPVAWRLGLQHGQPRFVSCTTTFCSYNAVPTRLTRFVHSAGCVSTSHCWEMRSPDTVHSLPQKNKTKKQKGIGCRICHLWIFCSDTSYGGHPAHLTPFWWARRCVFPSLRQCIRLYIPSRKFLPEEEFEAW